jgi:hypothetical protein
MFCGVVKKGKQLQIIKIWKQSDPSEALITTKLQEYKETIMSKIQSEDSYCYHMSMDIGFYF